jgi:hypothetical protein
LDSRSQVNRPEAVMRTCAWSLLLGALTFSLPAPAGATAWRIPCATGYAVLGGAVGAGFGAAVAAGDSDAGYAAGVIGILAAGPGALVGWQVGAGADRSLAEGEPLTRSRRNAVRVGTVLTGVGLGLIAATYHVQHSDANERGGLSDERAFAIAAGSGLAAGIGAALLADGALYPKVQPDGSTGGPGLRLSWER